MNISATRNFPIADPNWGIDCSPESGPYFGNKEFVLKGRYGSTDSEVGLPYRIGYTDGLSNLTCTRINTGFQISEMLVFKQHE